MNATKKTDAIPFTLIELLVVVAIIAVLASMLLPALGKARYIAQETKCTAQLKQVALVWTSYASDNDDFYMDYGPHLPNAAINEHPRRKGAHLGVRLSGIVYDLRPNIRDYMGASLNDMMKCPLASPSWQENAGPTSVYDVDSFKALSSPGVISNYTFFATGNGYTYELRSTNQQMRRVGDVFEPSGSTAGGKAFEILAMDTIWGGGGAGFTIVTQRPPGGGTVEGGNYANSTIGWLLPYGQVTRTNIALTDGSVNKYVYSKADPSWLQVRNDGNFARLPAELAE